MPHTGLTKQNGKEFKPMGLLSKAKKAADAAKRAAAIAKKAAAAAKKETGKHVDDLVGKPKRNAEGIKKIKPVINSIVSVWELYFKIEKKIATKNKTLELFDRKWSTIANLFEKD